MQNLAQGVIISNQSLVIQRVGRDQSGQSFKGTVTPDYIDRIGPEANTKRQVTQHGCMPCLLGDRDKGIEIVYCEGKTILYWAD